MAKDKAPPEITDVPGAPPYQPQGRSLRTSFSRSRTSELEKESVTPNPDGSKTIVYTNGRTETTRNQHATIPEFNPDGSENPLYQEELIMKTTDNPPDGTYPETVPHYERSTYIGTAVEAEFERHKANND